MIFVLGTGRSGTSFVARVLVEEFGVDMGDVDPPEESVNPGGDFEDVWIREATIRAVKTGRLGAWRVALRRHAEGRAEPWGLKDPRFAHVCTDLLALFPGADLVWCDRDLEAAARSAAGVATGGYDHHLRVMQDRYVALERALRAREHLRLDMTGRQAPGRVADRLRALPTLRNSEENRGSFQKNASRVRHEGGTSVVSDPSDGGSVSGSGP